MVAGAALGGVLDGTWWATLLAPTLAFRPAILFALTLVFGWRGFFWSQLLFLLSFAAFFGWRGALILTPEFCISQALALFCAQRIAGSKHWLSRERPTLGFLAGAILAPAIPALSAKSALAVFGIFLGAQVPSILEAWLRGAAAILALAPAILFYCTEPLRRWAGLPSAQENHAQIKTRDVAEVGIEVAVWIASFALSVHLDTRYHLNVTYLTFLAPLAFALLRGMGLTTLALAANAVIGSALWQNLHWAELIPVLDFRLLISTCSATILVLAAVVDERQRRKVQVASLLEAQAALRESEERFRRVFEEGPLGVAIVSTDFRFVRVNNALCRMVGYTEEELVRLTFVDITHPDDVSADVHLAEKLCKGEIPLYRMQKRYRKKSGEIIWINLTASMIHDSSGAPLYALSLIEDITEMKRTQSEALFLQKLESVGTLAGGIAHDFNNLLGAINSQAELGLAELNSGDSCRRELNAIGEIAMRGSEIVRQLMIYAGKENAVFEVVDLSKTVEDMLALLKISVTKRASIKTELDHGLPTIEATAAQVRQIVMNLITNASDAIGDHDGMIRVTTQQIAVNGNAREPAFQTLREGIYAQLEVSDTGCGMSPQMQANVFDPFFTTKTAGRGLGLAVVHRIVQNLGGTIHFTSELNRGTTFRILLPCASEGPPANGSANPQPSEPIAETRGGTLLIVEDESHLRQAVVKLLRKRGFEVFDAADGTAAIRLLRADGAKIDAVLLDMTLPGASSYDVIAEAATARPDIKVILTSAYTEETAVGAFSAPQIRGFIRKPFQLEDLLKMVRSSLRS
jgi:PAS domain S-box-containing protein